MNSIYLRWTNGATSNTIPYTEKFIDTNVNIENLDVNEKNMYSQTHPNGNTPYRNSRNINKASMRKKALFRRTPRYLFICEKNKPVTGVCVSIS